MAQDHVPAEGRQITTGPYNHMLDENDNWSPDGRFLVYDTRETVGAGIDNSQSIEKVEVATGEVTVLYAPEPTITGPEGQCAPGVGAVSHSPVADEVLFIHGPFVSEIPERGHYGKPNRKGAVVASDGSQKLGWADYRDVAADRPTLPGAHRGGTHRHEYTLDGSRIGFTYDDFLLPEYERTIGMLLPRSDAPGGATHYFAVLIQPVKRAEAKPGAIVRAAGDSWVGRGGFVRAFVGTVMEEDGSYKNSLFVCNVPADIDLTTADAGDAARYPSPPKGVTIRRLTHNDVTGIARGNADGDQIVYLAEAPSGNTEVFLIPTAGSDRHSDEAMRPVQITHTGAEAPGPRWHPSGRFIAVPSDGGIAVVCVEQGADFGKAQWLTPHGDGGKRDQPCWAPDGASMAYCKKVPSVDAGGKPVKTYNGLDMTQIFVAEFPGGV